MSNIIKVLQTTLKGTLSTTGTSFTVQKFVDSKGVEVDYADFNGNFVVVIEQGTNIEIIKCSGISQSGSNDNATITVATNGRHLNPKSPYTGGATGLLFTTGATVRVTNDPYTMSRLANLDHANTFSLLQTFTLAPRASADAVASNELVRKSQLDNAVLGTLSSAPVVVPAVAGETVAVDQLVYFKSADSRWWLADADTASTVENVILGITRGAGTAGVEVTNGVTILGEHVASSAIFVADTHYYASNTAGGFSSTAGTKEVSLGQARNTTKIYFYPRFNQQLTEDQKDALAGSSGTPSALNKLITENDTTNGATVTGTTISFDSASKEIRDSANGFVTAGFRAGASVAVTGTTSNNSTFTILSVVAGVIVVAEAVVTEASGASVTLAVVNTNKVVRMVGNKLPPVDGSNLTNILAGFGGDGSDGALTVASGTTNIDLGGLAVVVKNYTAISITGTGKVTFTNPHANGTLIIFKSQGDVTLTSSETPMIDLRSLGGAGGAGSTTGTLNAGTSGIVGRNTSGGGVSATAGSWTQTRFSSSTFLFDLLIYGVIAMLGGGGSGGGGQSGGTGGAGGNGAGSMVIECGGAWNFTTANGISVAGANAGSRSGDGGGGGGGGGGLFLAIYNTLTANSGSVVVTGGTATGGNANTGGGGGAGAGADGTSGSGSNGGNGGAGLSMIVKLLTT